MSHLQAKEYLGSKMPSIAIAGLSTSLLPRIVNLTAGQGKGKPEQKIIGGIFESDVKANDCKRRNQSEGGRGRIPPLKSLVWFESETKYASNAAIPAKPSLKIKETKEL